MMNFFYERNKKKIMGELDSFINNLIHEKMLLQEQLRSYDVEERVAKLLAENKELRSASLHVLTEAEKEQAVEFKNEHWDKCEGNVSYILTGTGVGTGVDVVCTKCGTKKDVTDYSVW